MEFFVASPDGLAAGFAVVFSSEEAAWFRQFAEEVVDRQLLLCGSTTNEVRGDFLRHFSDVQWWDSGVVSDGIQRRRQNCCVVAGSDSIKSLTALGEPGYFALAAKFCKSNNQTNPRPTTLDFANSLLDNPRE